MAVTAVSAAVGERLRLLRSQRGMSLSELARQAHVGKGTLSQIESGARNPTLETLYVLCGPLGIPLSGLIGEVEGASARAAGGMTSVLLDLRKGEAGRTVEVYRLEFPAGARNTSPAHGDGVTERLMVTFGRLRAGPGRPPVIGAGESAAWTSARPHSYAAVGGSAEAVVVIATPGPA